MKNSMGTIKKYVAIIIMLCETVYDKIATNLLKVCITVGNSKIGKSLNVSIPAILSCGNCGACMHYCYAINDTIRRGWNGNVIHARARNWSIFKRDRDEFFNQIHDRMRRSRKIRTLRFHVEGEIMDLDHFDRIVKTAEMFPDWEIWMYSKMDALVDCYISRHGALPKNLSVMRSQWGCDNEPVNPHGLGRFITVLPTDSVETVDHVKANYWKCPYDCEICKREGRGCIVNETSWVYLH